MKAMMICAIIGAMAVFILVASLFRQPIREATSITMQFLKDWAVIIPENARAMAVAIVGTSISFVFLLGLTVFFNKVGEQLAAPAASVFGYFGKDKVQWAEEQNQDWRNFRDAIIKKWGETRPKLQGKSISKIKERFRETMEKDEVRIARTLFVFALLLPVAGLADIVQKTYRKRGIALAVIGLLVTLALCAIWTQTKNGYIETVISVNRTLMVPEPVPAALR